MSLQYATVVLLINIAWMMGIACKQYKYNILIYNDVLKKKKKRQG